MLPATLSPKAFDGFVAPARAWPQLWRVVLGLGVIVLVYFAWIALMFGGLALVVGLDWAPVWMGRVVAAVDAVPTLLLLASFLGLVLGTAAAARLLHRRGFGTLLGHGPRVLHDFAVAVLVVAVVYAVVAVPSLWMFGPVRNLDPWLWLRVLPLALIGVLVQTLAEELVFRGYLLQQLAARFRSALVWLVLPSLMFGALHFNPNTSLGAALPAVLWATLFGLLAADLTRRTGSLGAAWGLHFANNAVALLLVATSGSLTGLALWRTPFNTSDAVVPVLVATDGASLLLVWLVLVRLLRR